MTEAQKSCASCGHAIQAVDAEGWLVCGLPTRVKGLLFTERDSKGKVKHRRAIPSYPVMAPDDVCNEWEAKA